MDKNNTVDMNTFVEGFKSFIDSVEVPEMSLEDILKNSKENSDCDEYESIVEEDFGDIFPDSTIDIEMFDEEN